LEADVLLESHIKLKLVEQKKKNKDLAAYLGVSVQSVTNWSSGHASPPLETAFKIAEFLDCKVDDLYTYIKE